MSASGSERPLSAVYVLEQASSRMVIVGKADGLGAGEQIYAVRFACLPAGEDIAGCGGLVSEIGGYGKSPGRH